VTTAAADVLLAAVRDASSPAHGQCASPATGSRSTRCSSVTLPFTLGASATERAAGTLRGVPRLRHRLPAS
jgi:hypothetical protein